MGEEYIRNRLSRRFDVGIALFSFNYRSFSTVTQKFPLFVHGCEPNISIAVNSRGLQAGNNCKFCFRLPRLRLRAHVADLLPV